MIAAVRGQLEQMGTDSVLINVGGVSLRVFVPTSVLDELGEIGREVKLFTHFYVREDQLALYGFKTTEQQELFEMLLSVSGVGPRAALNLIGTADVGATHLAIAQSNVDFLKKVSGIGPKTAARIILELKGKLVDVQTAKTSRKVEANPTVLERRQLVEALGGLGYTPAEIQTALNALPAGQELSLEEQVLEALRFLGQ
ncbi:MAG: Holliday junction branch migration protein RuvA [Chloroflexi bacterium]|uniref:Holliday junction branch migration complex subunit RuvA n=1 Tax=Candidatus Chlorohelix allophototropha TaxID=3003348 RepID=A0A8T7M423_9CHLR|nr:Holliday junction branch migration protein RuvA [Chloroflexota bacterium]WJW70181.1 Holliday junction branch migration protein RuvA [Chloroflexota bacterium L227-S17]